MINDGHYKFARYFSLKQHHIPATLAELLENNDVELFDLVNDPEENHNLAREPEKYRDLLMTMNDKLNQLTAAEIGEDDGSYMPPFEGKPMGSDGGPDASIYARLALAVRWETLM